VSRILVLRDIEQHPHDPPQPDVVTDRYPGATRHGWKFIAFGPDGNAVCADRCAMQYLRSGPRLCQRTRINADGSGLQDVAYGIRNTAGFAWRPGTGQLWFTDKLSNTTPGTAAESPAIVCWACI
jgi:glucose/arabinose dehydrogenase